MRAYLSSSFLCSADCIAAARIISAFVRVRVESYCPDKVMVKRFGHPTWVTEYLDRIQNRQETYHERLSNFNILSATFRHGKSSKEKMELHRMAVDCVAFLVHYDLKYHPLMDV